MRELSIATDFSRFPAGRFPNDGPFPGARFRDEVLAPALKQGVVMLLLDGTMGYGSSFLEEAFGGLVRDHKFTASELRRKLILSSNDKSLIKEIWSYVDGAEASISRS